MADPKSAAQTKPASSAAPSSSSSSHAPSASAPSFTPAGEDPLESRWTFYFDKKLSREAQAAAGFNTYAQNLQKVGTVDTIQGFWRHYAFMQQPDSIPRDHNLYLMKGDYLPAWESFPEGGSWIIKVRNGNGVINRLWEELCFACAGEWFEDADVAGCSVSIRAKDSNLAVWNFQGMNANIGAKLKDLLNLDESTQVEYKSFRSSILDNSSFRNAKQYTYAPVV